MSTIGILSLQVALSKSHPTSRALVLWELVTFSPVLADHFFLLSRVPRPCLCQRI